MCYKLTTYWIPPTKKGKIDWMINDWARKGKIVSRYSLNKKLTNEINGMYHSIRKGEMTHVTTT